MQPIVKKCKYCGKEIIETYKTKKYCSYKCFRAFEDQPASLSRGFMTRLIGNQRDGHIWKKTERNVMSM